MGKIKKLRKHRTIDQTYIGMTTYLSPICHIYTGLTPTLLSFFLFFFLCFNFLNRMSLPFQNNISFLLIFSDIDNRQTMIQTLTQIILSLACLYHLTYPYLFMFTYTATISNNLAPAGLIPSQFTYRTDWNFTYNNVSDRATNKLKASQLTSWNRPAYIWVTVKASNTIQIFFADNVSLFWQSMALP